MPIILITLGLCMWGALIAIARMIQRAPRDESEWALAWLVVCAYTRLVHRVRFEGLEHVPRWQRGDPPLGPLVVVSNHTAGVDPLLVHAACTFDIRWMMMREMMLPSFNWLWTWIEIIAVEQNGRDAAPVRTAIRHLQSGGVIGIFAEGGIERPARRVMPFLPGVGLLVLKSGARVLPAVIRGTPVAKTAYGSLLLPSRSVVKFLPMRSFDASTWKPDAVAAELERGAADALGWARSDAKNASDAEGSYAPSTKRAQVAP